MLQGEKPRLIDEWQLAPTLWDSIRFEADHTDELGLYILTGSSVPANINDTIASYINSLKRIFVVEDVAACAALGMGPSDLVYDLETFGLVFETLCMRDLRVYAEALQGNVYHYRDKNGLECDAVVHLRNGSYGLIEIKLGGDKLIAEGVKTLTALSDKIDTTRMKKPSFIMVLTANGPYAYRRDDGVYIVPISCLKD